MSTKIKLTFETPRGKSYSRTVLAANCPSSGKALKREAEIEAAYHLESAAGRGNTLKDWDVK